MKNLGHENGGCVLTGRGCSCWRRVYTGGGVNTLQGAVQLDWMKYDHICFIRHAWDEIKKRSFCGDMPWVRFVPSLLLGSLLHSGLREAERGRRQSLADGEGRRWIQQTGWAGRQGGRGLPLHLLMIYRGWRDQMLFKQLQFATDIISNITFRSKWRFSTSTFDFRGKFGGT